MKHIKKKYIIIIIVCLSAILWGVMCYQVNAGFPRKTIEEYQQGDWLDYTVDIEGEFNADVKLQPENMVCMSGTAFAEAYPISTSNNSSLSKYYVMVLSVLIVNKGTDEVGIQQLFTYSEFSSLSLGMSNSLTYICEDGQYKLQPGEEKSVKLASVISKGIVDRKWDQYVKSTFALRMTSYPIEKRLIYKVENIQD